MYDATDAVGIDKQPKPYQNKGWITFFFVYFFVGAFLLINLFTGEIVETFNKNKEKESSLTSEQKEWLHIKNSIYKLMPKGKKEQQQSSTYFYKLQCIFYKFKKKENSQNIFQCHYSFKFFNLNALSSQIIQKFRKYSRSNQFCLHNDIQS
eukprot:TRINITY_DN25748_c0_g1_i1.p2 TRINITY_DN25748_c0_g1~~TRINITY_DN25748_c0_g1_i1.p2  ORF type:complete len:151 (-),score=22.42 TRINITY_DN25748_c0_g1_i1:75-527(-)